MVRKYKPRPGKRRYTKYDPEIIKKALKQHANSNASLAGIANEYKISKSVLHRRIHNTNYHSIGGQPAFSSEREEHIIKYINACAPWQYSLQCWDLRLLIKFYLDRRPVVTKRKLDNNLPGPELVANFLKRHEDTISQRTIQNLNSNGSVAIEAVLGYFHELKLSIADVDPNNIVYYNDILITDDIETNKNETEEGKSNDIFVMTAASASGVMLNPYIMYKDQRCYDRTRRSMSMSKQTRSKLNGNIFNEWFQSVILPFFEGKPGKKCLIGSYFSSRISMDIIKTCKEQNIHFTFLPDNSRNLTQPLDTLSQLISSEWSNIILHQTISDGNKTKGDNFRKLVQTIADNVSEQILEEFKRTGINPINPVEVLKQLPDYNETTIENVDEEFEKHEMMTNDNMGDVQVKVEDEWEVEYIDDNFDEDMVNIENNDHKKSSKLKGVGKKTKCPVTEETQWRNTGNQNNLTMLNLKLSPTNFEDDTSEDTTVDYITKNILQINDATAECSKDGRIIIKNKRLCSNPKQNEIYYVPALQQNNIAARHTKDKIKLSDLESEIMVDIEMEKDKTEDINNVKEIDPLSHCQNGSEMQTTVSSNGNIDASDDANKSCHCNGACHTHTRLLEAILSSTIRQEKWQERTAQAMEAQAQALANIARLLEGRGEGNPD